MQGSEQLKLEDYRVGTLPTLFYIPDFLTDAEQTQLLHHIYEVPESKWKSLKNRRLQNWGGVVHEKGLLPQNLPPWLTTITERICKMTGLFPSQINHVLINEYLPDQGIMHHQDGPAYFPVVAIISLQSPVVIDFSPHVKLKESLISDQCTPKDSTIDREAVTKLDDSSIELAHPCSLLLKPCSLFLFKDTAYADYLHGIEDSHVHKIDKVVNVEPSPDPTVPNSCSSITESNNFKDDKQASNLLHRSSTRISLTCRVVPKVYRNLFKF